MGKPYLKIAMEQTPGKDPTSVAKTVTVTFITALFACTAHGLTAGVAVEFTNSGGALPAGLNADQTYYVISDGLTVDAFKVSTTVGGSTITLTSAGTGTHSVLGYVVTSSDAFYLPFQSFKPAKNSGNEDRGDEARNLADPVEGYPNEANPSWDLKERAYPNLIGPLLLLFAGQVATTAGDGIITDPDGNTIPTGAHRHVFTRSPALVPQSISAWFADQSHDDPTSANRFFGRMAGVALESLKLSGNKGALSMDAKGKALYQKRIGDPGLTPVLPVTSLLPWSYGQMVLTWLTGGATREDFDLNFEQKLWFGSDNSRSSLFPTAVEQDKEYRQISGSVSMRSLDPTDWDAVQNATTFAALAKYASLQNIGATSYPYRMWVDMPRVSLTKGDDGTIENNPRRPYKMDFLACYDDTAAYAWKITLVNGVAGYRTGLS
ncbi:MAG: hypothetical protein WC911_03540 [Thermoleophilia bacterium]